MKRLVLFVAMFGTLPLLTACSREADSGSSGGGTKPASANSNSGSDKSSSDNAGGGETALGAKSENTVTVTADQQRVGGIHVASVEPQTIPRTLSVPGQIMLDDQRTAHVSPYADGKVVDVLGMAGDQVHRGEPLAHLHSHSVHETVGALAQDFANVARMQAAVTYAQEKSDRYHHLYSIQAASLEQQQTSDQELVQAKTDLANAQAAITMEREHLGDLLQIEPSSITPANLYSHELVPITSPIAGTIITRTITPGMVYEPGNEAYTISDLSSVWMVAAVNDAELAHLHMGEAVVVRSDAWPGRDFPGRVTLIGSTLDPTTRTVQVRATLRNPHGELKPQMFVNATINEANASSRDAILVPENALQEVNGVQVVFVTADGTHFAPRALKTAPAIDGQVEVTEGLRAGDHIAVAGAFLLKSDLLKGTIGDE